MTTSQQVAQFILEFVVVGLALFVLIIWSCVL